MGFVLFLFFCYQLNFLPHVPSESGTIGKLMVSHSNKLELSAPQDPIISNMSQKDEE